MEYHAQHLARALEELMSGESFRTNMQTMLVYCLKVLLRRPGSSLRDLVTFLDEDCNHELIEHGKQLGPDSYQYFSHTFVSSHSDPTKSAIRAKMQSLLSLETFAKVTCAPSSFSLHDLINHGGILLFNLSATGGLGDSGREALGRLLVATFRAVAEERALIENESKRPQTHLIIDEFQHFVGDSSKRILEENRKYGLYLTLATQVHGQNMSTGLREAVLANTNLKMVGKNTARSLRAFAEEIGVDNREMEELGTGRFLVHTMQSQDPARFIQVTDRYLKQKGKAPQACWQAFVESQLERFYRSDDQSQVRLPSTPPRPDGPFQPGGQF